MLVQESGHRLNEIISVCETRVRQEYFHNERWESVKFHDEPFQLCICNGHLRGHDLEVEINSDVCMQSYTVSNTSSVFTHTVTLIIVTRGKSKNSYKRD